jgi:hypothetical protein
MALLINPNTLPINPPAFVSSSKLVTTAEELNLPVENLMTPETIRRVLWSPPETVELLQAELTSFGARPWQIEIVSPVLETAIWNLNEGKAADK